jgi:DNA-binding response OmpR family regulator
VCRTITAVEDLLLAGADADLAPLRSALEASGVASAGVERAFQLEQAIRSSRAAIVVIAEGTCDPGQVSRLRRAFPDRRLVAWLPRAATARTAELLRQGFVEVLSPAMGRAELLARVENARARRSEGSTEPASLGPLTVDAPRGRAAWAGRDLRLTRREREVLHVLVEAAPHAVRREEVYRSVWGYAMARGDRTVDVNVTRLRAKVAAVTDGLVVATEPGVGYRLELAAGSVAVTGP